MAYCDDTELTEMRDQRWHGRPSARRDAAIDENLARFEEMKSGSVEGTKMVCKSKNLGRRQKQGDARPSHSIVLILTNITGLAINGRFIQHTTSPVQSWTLARV